MLRTNCPCSEVAERTTGGHTARRRRLACAARRSPQGLPTAARVVADRVATGSHLRSYSRARGRTAPTAPNPRMGG